MKPQRDLPGRTVPYVWLKGLTVGRPGRQPVHCRVACLFKKLSPVLKQQEEGTVARSSTALVPAGADLGRAATHLAWLGLRVVPIFSWFGGGGEQPPVAIADLELAVLSRIFVVLDYFALELKPNEAPFLSPCLHGTLKTPLFEGPWLQHLSYSWWP